MSRTREHEIRSIIDEPFAFYDDGARVRAIARLDGVSERDIEDELSSGRAGGRSADDIARSIESRMRRD